MTNREQAAALLECVPPYKMGYALAYLQGITAGEGENIPADDPAADEYNKGGSENE